MPGWGSQSSPVSLQPAHEFDDSSDPSGSFAIGAFGASLGPHRHALSRLNQAIVEFVDMVEQDSQRRLLAKMQALRHVKAAVNALWPRAQVKVFGSFVTGLQLPSSDLDVVICLPNVRRVINHQWAIASKGGTLEGTDGKLIFSGTSINCNSDYFINFCLLSHQGNVAGTIDTAAATMPMGVARHSFQTRHGHADHFVGDTAVRGARSVRGFLQVRSAGRFQHSHI